MTCAICIVPCSLRTVVLCVGAAILAGQTPQAAQRHAVPERFNVPNVNVSPHSTGSPENLVGNPGFETGKIDGGWYQCGDVAAYAIGTHPHSGSFDQYSGTRNGAGEPHGNSGVCQPVSLPTGAILTAWLYQLSNEPDASFAYQEADLLDDRGNVVINLYKAVNNKPAWVRGVWNLSAFSGRKYWLYFGVHGDGDPKFSTQQFLDDVTLRGSSSPPPE
jgi:hypothetical protein